MDLIEGSLGFPWRSVEQVRGWRDDSTWIRRSDSLRYIRRVRIDTCTLLDWIRYNRRGEECRLIYNSRKRVGFITMASTGSWNCVERLMEGWMSLLQLIPESPQAFVILKSVIFIVMPAFSSRCHRRTREISPERFGRAQSWCWRSWHYIRNRADSSIGQNYVWWWWYEMH